MLQKDRLRQSVLQKRMALSPAAVTEKSNRIINKILTWSEYLKADTIMTYLDFRNEVQTERLVLHSMEVGKQVVVTATETKERRLIPSLIQRYPEGLHIGRWGIREPQPQFMRPIALAEIDLVLVPGVAFDLQGNRLGYGGGYYDRFLARLWPEVVFAALAFELQVQTQVYAAPHDIPIHYLITEERLIKISS